MKDKLLVTGREQSVQDRFIDAMEGSFACMTTSLRSTDIANHIRYCKPNAVVYCLSAGQEANVADVRELRAQLKHTDCKLIVAGAKELGEEFAKKAAHLVSGILGICGHVEHMTERLNRMLQEYDVREAMERIKQEELENDWELRRMAEEERCNCKENGSDAAGKKTKHILVIDDDPIMLRIIKEKLKDTYNVATAVSGKIGLGFLQRKNTDLILLDYAMPGENGAEVLTKLRADERTRDIPVIFMTGLNEEEKNQKISDVKPQGYLQKPIDHNKLAEAIRRIIG